MRNNFPLEKISTYLLRRLGGPFDGSPLQVMPDVILDILPCVPKHMGSWGLNKLLEAMSDDPPTRAENRLKMAFWADFEDAQIGQRKINLQACLPGTGILSWDFVIDRFKRDHPFFLWFLTPPPQYRLAIAAIHARGLERIEEIINLSLYKDDGNVDTKTAALVMKAFELVDNRLYGAVTKRNINYNMHANVERKDSPETMEEIQKKLEELRAQRNTIVIHADSNNNSSNNKSE